MHERNLGGDTAEIIEIRIRGWAPDRLMTAFPELVAVRDGADTLLRGHLPDTAALHGVLAAMEALGLELIEFRRHAAGGSAGHGRRDGVIRRIG
jgi:hypothetical protein